MTRRAFFAPLAVLVLAATTAGCTPSGERSAALDASTDGTEGPETQPPPDGGGEDAPADATTSDATDAGTDAFDEGAADTLADAGGDGADGADCDDNEAGPTDAPGNLRCTGLYDDWSSKHVAAGNTEYAPAIPLWSDGAEKRRWVHLPAGAQIDTTDMDEWTFPVGTKFWKEFAFGGKRVETRLYWKSAAGTWTRTTYQWNDDGSDAVRLDFGYRDPDAGPGGYEIPSTFQCDSCHKGRKDRILGFEAVNLGLSGASGVTLANLVDAGTLTVNPGVTSLAIPEDATGHAAAALGFLHSNCGMVCHSRSPQAYCGFKGLYLRLAYQDVASTSTKVTDLDAYTTSVGVGAPFAGANYLRIAPHDLPNSAIVYLMSQRVDDGSGLQMPPIDTHVVDAPAVTAVSAWIAGLP